MLPLFRDEAVRHATGGLDGQVLLPVRISIWLIGGVLAGALAVAGWFATTASYARTETITGWLAPESGVVRAAASRGGVVVDILVGAGDLVLQDAPLARMRLPSHGETGINRLAIIQTLEKQRYAILAAYEATLLGLAAERARLTARLASLQAEQALATLSRSAKAIRRDIKDVANRLDGIPGAEAVARAETDAAIGALDEKLARLDWADEYTVTAPLGGRVDTLVARVGQSLAAGSAVAVLVPIGDELVAELFVPPRAAGFVDVGQTVELKYEAFPFQRFGSQEATVDKVSLTVLSRDQAGRPDLGSSLEPSEPVFSARGRLATQTVQAYGASVPLRAGMLLSADIVLDRRTLVEWLLEPLYAVDRR